MISSMDWIDQFAKALIIQGVGGIFLLDESGIIRFANIRALDFFHLTPEDIIGQSVHAVVHQAPRKERTHSHDGCPFIRLIENGEPVIRHFDIFWKDRRPFWMEYTLNPIVSDSGERAFVMSFVDAAAALRGRSSFIENEARYKRIFEVSFDPKVIINREYRVEEANPIAVSFFKRSSVVGENVFDLFPKEGRSLLIKLYRSAKRHPVRLEPVAFVLPDGEELFIEVSVFTEILPGKSLMIFRDTTARVLEQRSREQFLALVGHELKTPLAVIKAFSQLLMKSLGDTSDKKISRYLQHIDEKVNLLTGLINGMLDAIHLGSGKFPFHDQLVSFDELVDETIYEFQKTLPQETIKVVGKTNSVVNVDKHRVSQVISNLIMNAIKYSPEGADIQIESVRDGSTIRLSITDHGPGIPKKEQVKLFNPFFRGKVARQGVAKGLGLGLYLAKQLIRHYKGGIAVQSKYGKGSTFTIELPVVLERRA
jgi:PAS domain S-box-containing protein